MNQHTISVMTKMTQMLSEYEAGKLNLRYLVDSLEGSINVIEEKMPADFMNRWYEYWGDLEIILSSNEEEIYKKECINQSAELEKLLHEYIILRSDSVQEE
jgi:hypothetical protein